MNLGCWGFTGEKPNNYVVGVEFAHFHTGTFKADV